MVLFDSNIFIYAAQGTLDRQIVADASMAHAGVTKIECLGFSRMPANELLLLQALFDESYALPLTDVIVDRAIKLRQVKNMNLGDAIIAATALECGLELWTANVADFMHIEGLKLYNPLG